MIYLSATLLEYTRGDVHDAVVRSSSSLAGLHMETFASRGT